MERNCLINRIKIIPFYLFLLVLIFACSSQNGKQKRVINYDKARWPIFRGDKNLSGKSYDKLPEKLSLLWSFQTGNDIKSSPVIGMENTYIGSTDGKLYALKLLTGKKIWEFDTGDDIEAPPLLLDSTLFIGNLSGNFFSINALTGELIWKNEIGGDIYGSANWLDDPSGSGKWILVGTYDNLIYSLRASDGSLNWTYEVKDFINGAPAVDQGLIVFGSCDEHLHILSGIDGQFLGEVNAGSYIPGSPALEAGFAYVGHYGNQLICVDLKEKLIRWKYEDEKNGSPFFSSPALSENVVVVGSRDKFVHCVEKETGRGLWKFPTFDDVDSSPVICDGKVVVGSMDGRLYLINLSNGKKIWSYQIGAPIIGSPAVAGGIIIVGAEDGRLYAFGEAL
jgi:outer membrane protein assembly factor BamB